MHCPKKYFAVFLLAGFFAMMAATPCYGKDPKAESKKHFQKGIKYYNNEQIEDALIEFHKAYVTYPHWKIRKNIGLCYMKLGDNVLALQELNAYLEEGKSQLKSKEEESVMNVIFIIVEEVGIIRFEKMPQYATVMIDGQVNSDAGIGKDVYVDPGLHVISVTGPSDNVLYREEIYINRGELKEVDVTKATGTFQAGPGKATKIPGWQEVGPTKKRNLKKVPKAAFGFSLALSLGAGAGAIVTGVLAQKKNNEFNDLKDTGSAAELQDLKDQGQTLETTTNALIGVFAGLAVVSLVLGFFTNFKGKKSEQKVAMPTVVFVPDLQYRGGMLSTEFRF